LPLFIYFSKFSLITTIHYSNGFTNHKLCITKYFLEHGELNKLWGTHASSSLHQVHTISFQLRIIEPLYKPKTETIINTLFKNH
jgi:hypothetical protein